MRSIKRLLHMLIDHHHVRHAKLPWAELEGEANRQGCSPADIFYDRAGRGAARLVSAMPVENDATRTG
jgi:hypothetical protein